MKVNHTTSSSAQSAGQVSQSKKAQKAKAAEKSSQTTGAQEAAGSQAGVRTELSARSKEAAKAREVAANAPDTREAKIAELKRRIAEGSYKVNSEAVADKMVDEHLQTAGIG